MSSNSPLSSPLLDRTQFTSQFYTVVTSLSSVMEAFAWRLRYRRNPPSVGSFFNERTKLKTENRGEQCISFSVKKQERASKMRIQPTSQRPTHVGCCLLSMGESFSVQNEKKPLLPETNNIRWESSSASIGPHIISTRKSCRNILQLPSDRWKHLQYLQQYISEQSAKCLPSIRRYLDRCL